MTSPLVEYFPKYYYTLLTRIKDLFAYHCNVEYKLKNGVNSIRVGTPEFGSWFCFLFTDDNNFEQDISYKKCRPVSKKDLIKAKNQDIKHSRLKAYRHAILNDTESFWSASKHKNCEICKSPYNIQTNHVKPFVVLVNEFEKLYQFKKYPSLKRHNESLQTFKFSISNRDDALFVENWQKFHNTNMTLQLLCSRCNLAKGADGNRYKPSDPQTI